MIWRPSRSMWLLSLAVGGDSAAFKLRPTHTHITNIHAYPAQASHPAPNTCAGTLTVRPCWMMGMYSFGKLYRLRTVPMGGRDNMKARGAGLWSPLRLVLPEGSSTVLPAVLLVVLLLVALTASCMSTIRCTADSCTAPNAHFYIWNIHQAAHMQQIKQCHH